MATTASVALIGAVSAASPARAAGTPPTPQLADGHGIHVVGITRIDDRQFNVKMIPEALGRAVDVRVLLPAGYGQHPQRHYPVLYLYHGTSGRASDWVTMGDAEKTTASAQLITVMPDAGFDGDGGGWFTDWVDSSTTLGPSRWESFHVSELVAWVDANLRTVAARRGRAIAGLSQGGFGAFTYAARHPDLFAAAASFSGAPEIDRDPDIIVGATAVIEATAYGLDGVQPDAMFGSRATNEINWQGHDPSTLITNLRGMNLSLWTASGAPGPYDTTPNPGASGIEALTHASTQHFHDHLQAEGIPSTYNDYVFGTHTWAYWSRDLRELIGPLTRTFAHPSTPRVISYRSVDRTWTQWGWSVSVTRPAAQEFSALAGADRHGFDLTGTGTAVVTTPAFYRPGAAMDVSVSTAPGVQHLRVGPEGQLVIDVPLGAGPSPTSAHVTVRTRR